MLATRQFPKPMIPGNALNSMPSYMQLSPSGGSYPQLPSSSISSELDKYLLELLSERQQFRSFMQAFPICSRLLNQEILRITGLVGSTSYGEHDLLEHGSTLASTGSMLNRPGDDLNDWSAFQSERLAQQAPSTAWQGLTGGSGVPGGSPAFKKVLRLEVPVDKYPNYNFVGRLLGPRGNSLKRVESTTGCRVFIRGRGSVKDSDKEEKLRDKPGYEHLNEPLHVLIEAEQPANVIDIQLNRAREIIEDLLKPVDESHDYFKKQQLRELAMLNGTLREETPYWSGSVSPFSNSGMKRAKTRQ